MTDFDFFSIPDEIAECIAIINASTKSLPQKRDIYTKEFAALANACEKYLAEYRK